MHWQLAAKNTPKLAILLWKLCFTLWWKNGIMSTIILQNIKRIDYV
jgi:hypothetical protein